jgi:hypothetical protein
MMKWRPSQSAIFYALLTKRRSRRSSQQTRLSLKNGPIALGSEDGCPLGTLSGRTLVTAFGADLSDCVPMVIKLLNS